jgi:tRNA pseudouridine synthase 10
MADLPKAKVFIEGRYRKLVRDLPQTVFFCPDCKGHPRRRKKCERCEGFGKLTRDSVQELIGWVAGAAFQTRKNKFHGAGREDIDVRMLGRGRPFVLEFINPKVMDVDLAAVEAEVNRRNEGRLEIEGLHWTEKARVRVIKETPHAKLYEARVVADGEVDMSRLPNFLEHKLQIVQQTPARVAHRRADKARERWVEFLTFEPVTDGTDGDSEENEYTVQVRTEHGTYVKEAINGEEGSTKPSLSELVGVPCRCVALDVLDILDEEGEKDPITEPPPVFGQNV